jgi:hypothetical protein
MKVSLTPDRLQSMEVRHFSPSPHNTKGPYTFILKAYKQKISQQAAVGKTQREEPQSPLAHTRKSSGRPFAASTRVAAIEEGEEDAPGFSEKPNNQRASTSVHSVQEMGIDKPVRVVSPPRTSSKSINPPGLGEVPGMQLNSERISL